MRNVTVLPFAHDNFCYLIGDPEQKHGGVCLVDPGEADVGFEAMEPYDCRLEAVLLTHRHFDHTGGADAIRARFGCEVIGPSAITSPRLDRRLSGGEVLECAGVTIEVVATPGHTEGHVAFLMHADQGDALFSGDLLFNGGCGRVAGNAYDAMWRSLDWVRSLDAATRIFPGHDYFSENVNFALSLQPHHPDLLQARNDADPGARATVAGQLKINPFLRVDDPELRRALGLSDAADDCAVFRQLRVRKDCW